jgi:hypothetical protein
VETVYCPKYWRNKALALLAKPVGQLKSLFAPPSREYLLEIKDIFAESIWGHIVLFCLIVCWLDAWRMKDVG